MPISRQPCLLEDFPEFLDVLNTRLEKGRQEYGDSSFTRPSDELAREIEEELIDVVGWAFFLWLRIRNIRKTLSTEEM